MSSQRRNAANGAGLRRLELQVKAQRIEHPTAEKRCDRFAWNMSPAAM